MGYNNIIYYNPSGLGIVTWWIRLMDPPGRASGAARRLRPGRPVAGPSGLPDEEAPRRAIETGVD